MRAKSSGKALTFTYAIKSFVGYLEGTLKSAHTIKNYKLDIHSFRDFLLKEHQGHFTRLEEIDVGDVERYRNFLKERGLKINTRRRKLLTVNQFLGFLEKRKKLPQELARKVATPSKVERVPFTVSSTELVELVRNLPTQTALDYRNQALLWTLAETGCLVSEVTTLKFEDWVRPPLPKGGGYSHQAFVSFAGKSLRTIPVSLELFEAIQELKVKLPPSPWIFLGHNKFGSLGAPMTPRGVEMLVKFYGPRLGCAEITPRTFRHSVILRWFEEGLPQQVIQDRLGLKTTYAFRSYAPLIKSNSGTTSIV